MTAAVRSPPDADLFCVHLRPRRRVGNRIGVVGDLQIGYELAPGLAGQVITLAEAAVVVDMPETTSLPLEEIAALFGDENEIMVFSEDIQTGSTAGELVIRERGRTEAETAAEKTEVPAHREVVELQI